MKKCKEGKDRQIRDYFLDRLSPVEMEEVQFHLLHCENCRDTLEQLRNFNAGCESVCDPGRKRVAMRFFTRAAVVAGLLLVLGGGGFYFMSHPGEENIPLEVDEPPVLHSGDSIAVDSTTIDIEIKGRDNAE